MSARLQFAVAQRGQRVAGGAGVVPGDKRVCDDRAKGSDTANEAEGALGEAGGVQCGHIRASFVVW